MELLESAVDAKTAEVVIDRRPGRELSRQQAPGATTPEHVEDAVEDEAQRPLARASGRLGWREQRSQDDPLGIGQVGRIQQRGVHRGPPLPPSHASPPSPPFSYSL